MHVRLIPLGGTRNSDQDGKFLYSVRFATTIKKRVCPSSALNPAGPPPEAELKAPSQHSGPGASAASLPSLSPHSSTVRGRTGLLFSLFLSQGRLAPARLGAFPGMSLLWNCAEMPLSQRGLS